MFYYLLVVTTLLSRLCRGVVVSLVFSRLHCEWPKAFSTRPPRVQEVQNDLLRSKKVLLILSLPKGASCLDKEGLVPRVILLLLLFCVAFDRGKVCTAGRQILSKTPALILQAKVTGSLPEEHNDLPN